MHVHAISLLLAIFIVVGLPAVAHAGMPTINVTDLGRMRISALSFFLAGFLLSSWGIQRLWNVLQRDFPRLPRLTFKAATGVVFLWGMLFVLVLTMISGARELMTPGAWDKQGLTYKLSEADHAPVEPTPDETLLLRREQKLQKLYAALLLYTARHDGRYPSDDETDAVDPDAWKLPDRLGARYLYVPGHAVNDLSGIVAYEPQVYDSGQLALWTDGRVQSMSTDELQTAAGPRFREPTVKRPGCLAVIAVVLLLLLAFIGLQAPIESLFFMVTGWAFFLGLVAPELSVSWQGVATAFAALMLFVVGFQKLATWWVSAARSSTEDDRFCWRWRWTLMTTAAVVLSFVAGIAVVGATHQLVWMATSKQPLVESSWKGFLWQTESRNRLGQIGKSLHTYHDEHNHLPAGGVFDRLGRPLYGWQTALLPYVDQAELFERINLEVPWDAPANAEAIATMVPAYANSRAEPEQRVDPSGRALTHFAGNGQVFNAGPGLPLSQFADGTSETFIAGEVNTNFKPWGHPCNWRDAALGLNLSREGFGSPREGGVCLLLADGSVRLVSDTIDQKVLDALATPNGRESVGDF